MTDRAQTAWVSMYCSRDKKARVAIFRRVGSEWQLTSVGNPAAGGNAAGGKLPVTGRFGLSPEYRGCPACGNSSYCRCNACGQIGCWQHTESYYTCGSCGQGGHVSGSIESLGALDAG